MEDADLTIQATAFRYTRALCVAGVTLPEPEIRLEQIDPNVEVFFTEVIDPQVRDADTALAIAELLLSGLYAPDKLPSAPDRIRKIVERNVAERTNRFARGPFVLFACHGPVETFRPTHIAEHEGIVVCFDGVSKDAIRAQFDGLIMSTLASIALALPSVVGLESVIDQVVLYRSDGNPVFSLKFKVGSARARVDHRIEHADFSRIVDRAASWSKMDDLRRVRELMLKSLLNEGDRLRAFLAAWTALEIVINKIFPHYEAALFNDFAATRPPPLPSYLQQVREVMKSRYRLADKFTVVCGLLDTIAPEADMKHFKDAKRIRDALSHGDVLSDDSLPLDLVLMLLRKYLELHIAAESRITRE